MKSKKQILIQLKNVNSKIEKTYKIPVGSGAWRTLTGYRNALEWVLNLE